jgi:hypothetical protein
MDAIKAAQRRHEDQVIAERKRRAANKKEQAESDKDWETK